MVNHVECIKLPANVCSFTSEIDAFALPLDRDFWVRLRVFGWPRLVVCSTRTSRMVDPRGWLQWRTFTFMMVNGRR